MYYIVAPADLRPIVARYDMLIKNEEFMPGEAMPAPLRPPLEESYWVLPGRLLAGKSPGDEAEEETREHLNALLAAGIDTFFDLREPAEGSYLSLLQEEARRRGLSIGYEQFPMADFDVPEYAVMQALLDKMDVSLASGRKVYIHCWGGIGRTGTAIGCFLVRHGKTGQQALDQIAEWWQAVPKRQYHPRSPETQGQVQFVLSWRESMRGASDGAGSE